MATSSKSTTYKHYRGADKSLARPGRKQARKQVRDVRDFNTETRAFIKFFFFFWQGKAPKEIHAILTETLACFLPGGLRTYQHLCNKGKLYKTVTQNKIQKTYKQHKLQTVTSFLFSSVKYLHFQSYIGTEMAYSVYRLGYGLEIRVLSPSQATDFLFFKTPKLAVDPSRFLFSTSHCGSAAACCRRTTV